MNILGRGWCRKLIMEKNQMEIIMSITHHNHNTDIVTLVFTRCFLEYFSTYLTVLRFTFDLKRLLDIFFCFFHPLGSFFHQLLLRPVKFDCQWEGKGGCYQLSSYIRTVWNFAMARYRPLPNMKVAWRPFHLLEM